MHPHGIDIALSITESEVDFLVDFTNET